MKLIKTMLTGMILLVFAIGQEQTDGGPPPPPPCDPNATYPVADPGPDGGCGNYNDCNGNGAYDLGEPCGDPVPFEDVDANADGVVDREEGRAQYGYDPNFDQQFDEADTNGDGVVDHPEYDAAVQGYDEAMQGGGPPHDGGPGGECGVCGYQFTGPDDMHGHCDQCDHVYTGDPNDTHGHCMACGAALEDQQGWDDHCNENPDHCGPPSCDEMDMNGDGVIDREEARDKFGDDPNFDQRYDEVDTNGDGVVDCGEHDAAVAAGPDGGPPHDGMEGEHDGMEGEHDGMEHMGPAPTNHWDGNCGAMMNGEDEYWLDSDGDGSPEDGPYAVWHEDADGNPVDCGPGPGDHDGGDNSDNSGDCGGFPGDEDGSIMVALPDGSERWLQVGEYTMNEDGSVTVNRPGDPDDGATVTPPPCDDSGNSNN